MAYQKFILQQNDMSHFIAMDLQYQVFPKEFDFMFLIPF